MSKKPPASGWSKLLREVPVLSAVARPVRKEVEDEKQPILPWKPVDDEDLLDETRLLAYPSSGSSNRLSTETSGRDDNSQNSHEVSTSSASSHTSSGSYSGSSSGSSHSTSTNTSTSSSGSSSTSSSSKSNSDSTGTSDQSLLSSHVSRKQSRTRQSPLASLREEEEDVRNDRIENVRSEMDEQTAFSLAMTDLDRPRRRSSFRRRSSWSRLQQVQSASNNDDSNASLLPDAGTIWSTIDGDTAGLTSSNESSMNYSEVSDITLFSAATSTPVVGQQLQPSQQGIDVEDDNEDGSKKMDSDSSKIDAVEKEALTQSQFQRTSSNSNPSAPQESMATSGLAAMDMIPLASTTDKDFGRNRGVTPPVASPQISPEEEGGFFAFLAQMRQITEQPVDAALREFVPSEVAENAKAAPLDPTGDDADTVLARNKRSALGDHQQPDLNNISSSTTDRSSRGGSMNWMFSIPLASSHSEYPLLGDSDTRNAPDFREIPLSYSPSARIQPWGPNTSDLWTSTTRLLAAIPEEVASVFSTASMSLSYTKHRQGGSVDEDPISSSKAKVFFATAIFATLIVAAVGLIFIILAILSSAGLSLVETEMPVPPIKPRLPSMTMPSRTPSSVPSFRKPIWSPDPYGLDSNSPVRSEAPTRVPSWESDNLVHASETPSGAPPAPIRSVEPTRDPGLNDELDTRTPSSGTVPVPGDEHMQSLNPSHQPGLGYGAFTEYPTKIPSFAPVTVPAPDSYLLDTEIPSSTASIDPTPVTSNGYIPSLIIGGMPSASPSVKLEGPSFAPSFSNLPESSVPSREPTFSLSSDSPVPAWFSELLDDIQSSSEPSVFSPLSPSTAPSLLFSSPGFLPTTEWSDAQTYEPTLLAFDENQPDLIDITTATPTEQVVNGVEWEPYGEVGDNTEYRSVKISETGNRMAVATSRELQVFERMDDGKWQHLGIAIETPGIQAVTISGDGKTIAHGTLLHGTEVSGTVFVHRWEGGAWVQIGGNLPGVCMYPGGMDLNSDGSIIAIGSPLDNYYTGVVTVMRYNDAKEQWDLLGEPVSGENSGELAGTSVSLAANGFVLAMGSPGRRVGGEIGVGEAAIFRYSPESGWLKAGQSLLGHDPLKQFGFSVSLSGDGTRVAVSAPFVDYQDNLRGLVYVFEQSSQDNFWYPMGDAIQGAYLADDAGTSVALSSDGRSLAVGAPRRSYVQVYTLKATHQEWASIGFIESDEDEFGLSVAMSSDGRIVGACGTNSLMNGAVQIFRRSDDLMNQREV